MAHIEIVGVGVCPIYVILERADDETVVQGVFLSEVNAAECCKNILSAFIDNKWSYPPTMTIEEWDLNHSIRCEFAMFHIHNGKIIENYYGSMRKVNKE